MNFQKSQKKFWFFTAFWGDLEGTGRISNKQHPEALRVKLQIMIETIKTQLNNSRSIHGGAVSCPNAEFSLIKDFTLIYLGVSLYLQNISLTLQEGASGMDIEKGGGF